MYKKFLSISSEICIIKRKMKKTYFTPEVVKIVLDNEISLVLATNPPIGPGEESQQDFDPNTEGPWE